MLYLDLAQFAAQLDEFVALRCTDLGDWVGVVPWAAPAMRTRSEFWWLESPILWPTRQAWEQFGPTRPSALEVAPGKDVWDWVSWTPSVGTIRCLRNGGNFKSNGNGVFNRWCKDNRLSPSMTCRGSCWDNAEAESFFSSLKSEFI